MKSVGKLAAKVQLQDMTKIIERAMKDLTEEERKRGFISHHSYDGSDRVMDAII